MKVVILAGGRGTRICEESSVKPKPMIEIGEKPILWHIMKNYAHFGFNDFIICLGYKGEYIKDYFSHYFYHHADITFDFTEGENTEIIHSQNVEPWRVTLVDTGIDTMTGGRLKRVQKYIGDECFLATYGDGLASVDINSLIAFHQENKKIATVTAVRPKSRFGEISFSGNVIQKFLEKPEDNSGWVSGGFFVFEPAIFQYINEDSTVLEQEVFERLVQEKNFCAYKHFGFFHPMDSMRDKLDLENQWKNGSGPWKMWQD